jgi:hypothetical protein
MGGDVRVTLVGRGEHVRVINDCGVLLTDSQGGGTRVGGAGIRAVADMKQVDVPWTTCCSRSRIATSRARSRMLDSFATAWAVSFRC